VDAEVIGRLRAIGGALDVFVVGAGEGADCAVLDQPAMA